MGVQQIASLDDLKSVVQAAGHELVVIDFYATWCGPCKRISPFFDTLSNEHPNVVFLRVDVDQAGDAAQEYGVEAMPTFKFIKNGQIADELVGASEADLRSKVNKHQ